MLNTRREFIRNTAAVTAAAVAGIPLYADASNIVTDVDNLVKLEQAGVGAIVYKSLFEEQIQLESYQLDQVQETYSDWDAEHTSFFPSARHAGPTEPGGGLQGRDDFMRTARVRWPLPKAQRDAQRATTHAERVRATREIDGDHVAGVSVLHQSACMPDHAGFQPATADTEGRPLCRDQHVCATMARHRTARVQNGCQHDRLAPQPFGQRRKHALAQARLPRTLLIAL